jgi:hypothetical protein
VKELPLEKYCNGRQCLTIRIQLMIGYDRVEKVYARKQLPEWRSNIRCLLNCVTGFSTQSILADHELARK